jgi:hypothetical protein
MKRLALVSGAVLALVVLASLASCKGGAFTDPGYDTGAYGLTSGSGSGGDYDYDDDDDDDYDSDISELSSSASMSQASSKLDEIISYCNNNPGNDSVKATAQGMKAGLSSATWDGYKGQIISSINGLIYQLQ